MGHWLAGLTDGEGCFSFYVRDKGPNCYSYDFCFKIALRSDDMATVVLAREILGIKGSTYVVQRALGSNGKPLATLRVQKKSEIRTVIEFFRKYPLRSKKARDFKVWTEAFEYYCGVISSTPIMHVSFAKMPRASAVKRRPLVGTPKAKLRRTPPEMVERMKQFAVSLKEVRVFA